MSNVDMVGEGRTRARPLHVLYVIDSLVPGGAERSLAALAPHYARLGIRLDVACLHDRAGVQPALHAAGAKVFCLAGPGGRRGWIRRTRRLLGERQPGLVHTTLFEADVAGRVAARLAGVPVVTSLVNETYGPEHSRDPAIRPWRLRSAQVVDAFTARSAVRFHAVAFHVAEVMARRLALRPDRIDVVPRGRDAAVLGVRSDERRIRARAMLGVEPRTPLVLAVARQEHQKGLDVLIGALPEVLVRFPEARVVVAGREGSETPALRQAVATAGVADHITFLGTREDVPDLLCAADAFVLPSRREGLPGSVLEAMALELPVVVSDLPQVREVIDDTCGRLVRPDDPVALADALVASLATSRENTTRVARARARFLDQFTIERSAEGMLAFYERALSDVAHRAERRAS